MADPWCNIEPIARSICERDLDGKVPEDELPDAIARYWHCVAAQLEAGIIDDRGNRVRPYDHDRDLEAYLDWRRPAANAAPGLIIASSMPAPAPARRRSR